MLKVDAHKKALEKLEKLIDLEHVESCEKLQSDMQAGISLDRLPCIVGFPTPHDWPSYSFVECWNDVEKNFISSLGGVYSGALVKDDRLCTIRPEYGVVNIPELFAVPSAVTNEGKSMSEGLRDLDTVKALIDSGVPEIAGEHNDKVEAFVHLAKETLKDYDKLSKAVRFIIPDTQGPVDLACLIWGSEIMYAVYDYPDVVHQLLELVTETYIEYSKQKKELVGQPLNSGYHIAGLKLAKGGVRICDDSSTLLSCDSYMEFAKPYNARAFEPFEGGWMHYCGNGNHFIDEALATKGVNYLHLGNPDHCDLPDLFLKTRSHDVVLFWSGSLERIREVHELNDLTGLLVLTENRYASSDLDAARKNLDRVRNYQPIAKAAY